ncbi:putative lipid II flippase FtsW, partial [Gordonia aichiensis]
EGQPIGNLRRHRRLGLRRGRRRGGAPGRTTRSAGTARAGQPERRATSRAASGSVRTGSGRYSGHPGRADKMSGGPRRSGNGR